MENKQTLYYFKFYFTTVDEHFQCLQYIHFKSINK